MFTLQLLISFPLCSRVSLVSDIEDLPPAVQEKLFDEVLDRDVQKGDLLCQHSDVVVLQQHNSDKVSYIRTSALREREGETERYGETRSKMTKIIWTNWFCKWREPTEKLYIRGRLPNSDSIVLLVFSLLLHSVLHA